MTQKLKSLLDRRSLVDCYLDQGGYQLSSHSFVNIFLWQDFFDFEFEVINEHLCIFAKHDFGRFLYLPPLGKKYSINTVEQCYKVMGDQGVARIENVCEAELPVFSSRQFSFLKKGYDYCYLKDDIVGLKGNPYKSKRSSLNQFVKNYHSQYEPYKSEMLNECLSLYEAWVQERIGKYPADDIYIQMLKDSAKAHKLGLQYFQELDLIGRVVKVENKIKAYSFGFTLNKDTFCILFEVADLAFKGLATYIFWKFCRDPELQSYHKINAMDDFELANVAQTKRSFRPSALTPIYTVKKR